MKCKTKDEDSIFWNGKTCTLQGHCTNQVMETNMR